MNTRSSRTLRTAQTTTEKDTTNTTPPRSTPPKSKAQTTKDLALNPKIPGGGRTPKPSGRSAEKATKAQASGTPVPESEPPKTISIDGSSITLFDFGLASDILLDVTFDNAHCRRSLLNLGTGQQPRFSNFAVFPKTAQNERVVYRVQLDTLKKTSKYFERLLTDTRFAEAKTINEAFEALKAKGVKPEDADVQELPRITITEDADATQVSGRSGIFSDLLRILHGQDTASKLSMPYLAILSTMADRFDCAPTIGRYTRGPRRIAWPQSLGQATFVTEEATRMKILVAWYLEDVGKFASCTKELIMRGSLRWGGRAAQEQDMVGIWWDLPDGIEGLLRPSLHFSSYLIGKLSPSLTSFPISGPHIIMSFPFFLLYFGGQAADALPAELHHRRTCILRTIASLQVHFMSLYTSKQRQCKMFYDSSVACDSFQLGETVRFFVSKNLFTFLSPISPPMEEDDYPEPYDGDIEDLIKDLRQCPSWQYDQNHAHCGLRTRLIPALDYIQAMLGLGVGIDWKLWKRDQIAASWETEEAKRFVLVKGVANAIGDARLNLKEILATPVGKQCFTASSWDWTGERNGEGKEMLGGRFGTATWKIPD